MGIRIPDEAWKGWERLRKMRNTLAHGDLQQYRQLTDPNGQHFASERHRAEFAYRAAVRFIYDIRYPSR